jgi:hypothetical protein
VGSQWIVVAIGGLFLLTVTGLVLVGHLTSQVIDLVITLGEKPVTEAILFTVYTITCVITFFLMLGSGGVYVHCVDYSIYTTRGVANN